MLDHTGFVVTDLAKARRFYDAIAEALGLATADNSPESFVLGRSKEEPIPYLKVPGRASTRPTSPSSPRPRKWCMPFMKRGLPRAEPTMANRGLVVATAITGPSCSTLTATISRRPIGTKRANYFLVPMS